jgi:hypothetical protein
MKDIEVLANGKVRLVGAVDTPPLASPIEPLGEPAASTESVDAVNGDDGATEAAAPRRPRRRGGRRRGGRGRKSSAPAPAPPAE